MGSCEENAVWAQVYLPGSGTQESSHPLTNQLCYYHEGREDRTLPFFPTRKTAGTAWIILPHHCQISAPKAPLQLFSPIFLPYSLPARNFTPNKQFNRKMISQSLSSPSQHISISESRGSALVSRVYCIIHATRAYRKDRLLYFYQTTDAPQGRLQGKVSQYSISPRTTAKLICKKIHCNVLFSPPPQLVGFNLFKYICNLSTFKYWMYSKTP